MKRLAALTAQKNAHYIMVLLLVVATWLFIENVINIIYWLSTPLVRIMP